MMTCMPLAEASSRTWRRPEILAEPETGTPQTRTTLTPQDLRYERAGWIRPVTWGRLGALTPTNLPGLALAASRSVWQTGLPWYQVYWSPLETPLPGWSPYCQTR